MSEIVRRSALQFTVTSTAQDGTTVHSFFTIPFDFTNSNTPSFLIPNRSFLYYQDFQGFLNDLQDWELSTKDNKAAKTKSQKENVGNFYLNLQNLLQSSSIYEWRSIDYVN